MGSDSQDVSEVQPTTGIYNFTHREMLCHDSRIVLFCDESCSSELENRFFFLPLFFFFFPCVFVRNGNKISGEKALGVFLVRDFSKSGNNRRINANGDKR